MTSPDEKPRRGSEGGKRKIRLGQKCPSGKIIEKSNGTEPNRPEIAGLRKNQMGFCRTALQRVRNGLGVDRKVKISFKFRSENIINML